jgi:hypothetical protein
MKAIKILHVTEEDIQAANGTSDGQYCPLSEAVWREFDVSYVFVSGTGITVDTPDGEFYYKLSKNATRIIDRYDRTKIMKPFNTRLTLLP